MENGIPSKGSREDLQRNSCQPQCGPLTVCRTVALFDETANVSPREYPSNVGTARLTEMDKSIILELVIEKPGIYLREIQQELESGTGTVVDVSTVCRFLHTSGFSRQKLVITAKQSDVLQAEHMIDMQCV